MQVVRGRRTFLAGAHRVIDYSHLATVKKLKQGMSDYFVLQNLFMKGVAFVLDHFSTYKIFCLNL